LSTNINKTDDIGFAQKYYAQLEKITQTKLAERKERLIQVFLRSEKRMVEQRKLQRKIDELMVEKEKKEENKKYEEKIKRLENKFSGKGSATATKRILKEYKHFQTNSDLENFEIKFKNEDNFYQWNLILDVLKFELSAELKEDFEYVKSKTGSDPTLEFEIIFPQTFPFAPPFIRVVKPIFQFYTGHVTIGGSMWMESLTPSGWSSVRSIEGLFIEILSIILQGGGRLDNARIGQ
jgi:ubiquitin-conjugating enzyme E2 Q